MDRVAELVILTLAAGTPLVFAALGELVTEKSGVLNLGVEGMMLMGAVTSFIVAVTTDAPWLGVLWILTIPYRFAQIFFIRELADLGRKAPEYAGHLETIAWVMFALLLLAVWGRAIYVRACLLGLQSGARVGREALRVPAAQLMNSMYGALLVEVLFALTAWMFIVAPNRMRATAMVQR